MQLPEIQNDQDFQKEIAGSSGYAVLLLYFSTCPECQAALRTIEADENRFFSRVKIAKMEVSDKKTRPDWVGDLRSVPAFVIFQDGREVKRLAGKGDETALSRFKDWIVEVINA